MWLGASVILFYTSRRLIRRKCTVTYQGQYFTIISSISECDHKCETRNAEPEIGPDGSSQTWRNPRVDGYWSGFGPPRVCGSGFWPVLEPNLPVFAVQTRTAGGLPGPVANSSDDIAFASYNGAPTQRQQFWWMVRTLHSNELHRAVPKSSFTWSVYAIYPCIELHKYVCNVLQI